MNKLGGGMRHVDEIRADGVAPVPVADACLHSHKDGPNTRRPHQSFRAAGNYRPKNARVIEGSALIGAEGPVSSSLVTYTNNRNNCGEQDLCARPVGRGKHCGKFTIKGWDSNGNLTRYRRVNCGSWSCCYCGPRKAKRAKRAIRELAERLGLHYFVTLTLDPSLLREGEDATKHLQCSFNKLRTYLRRKFGEAPVYIRVVEFTQRGLPHYHILTDRYIEQEWISRTWAGLGGGRIVWIRRARIQQIARYLAKYLTKELLLSAPKGTRRITTARKIRLFPKFQSEISWALVRSSIWFLFAVHRDAAMERQREMFQVVGIELDEESYLRAFAVPIGGSPSGWQT
jgi:hypothetical protein